MSDEEKVDETPEEEDRRLETIDAEEATEDYQPEYYGMCTECKTIQPDEYVERNAHYKAGLTFPCKYCGGPCAVVEKSQIEHAKAIMDRRRGL